MKQDNQLESVSAVGVSSSTKPSERNVWRVAYACLFALPGLALVGRITASAAGALVAGLAVVLYVYVTYKMGVFAHKLFDRTQSKILAMFLRLCVLAVWLVLSSAVLVVINGVMNVRQ